MIFLLEKFKLYIVGFFGVIIAIGAIFYKGKYAGYRDAREKQQEANNAAKARIEKVKPLTSSDAINKLRDGKF